ncbi:MAG: hypothetical protein GX174_10525 [Lentisphaerae bacterium]|nr:hypothetical protein [Lentisphaerota bacterium]
MKHVQETGENAQSIYSQWRVDRLAAHDPVKAELRRPQDLAGVRFSFASFSFELLEYFL